MVVQKASSLVTMENVFVANTNVTADAIVRTARMSQRKHVIQVRIRVLHSRHFLFFWLKKRNKMLWIKTIILCLGRCQPGEWRCNNGDCILLSAYCDRRYDCKDFSDERFCSKYSPVFVLFCLICISTILVFSHIISFCLYCTKFYSLMLEEKLIFRYSIEFSFVIHFKYHTYIFNSYILPFEKWTKKPKRNHYESCNVMNER